MHATTFETVQKPWGLQTPVLRNYPLHVDEIEVLPGGYCSVHRHKRKANLFHVFKGKLGIFCFNDSGAIIRTESLDAGEHCVVEAGVWHQFWTQTGCTAQELYFGTEEELLVVHDDIDRKKQFSLGGISLMLQGVPSMAGIYLHEAGS